MTDRQDGPPPRGPRRYGPSAGAPRTGGEPIVPPRRPLDDATGTRPGGSDRSARRGETGRAPWPADSGRPVRSGDAGERRRPDNPDHHGARTPDGHRRTPDGFRADPARPDGWSPQPHRPGGSALGGDGPDRSGADGNRSDRDRDRDRDNIDGYRRDRYRPDGYRPAGDRGPDGYRAEGYRPDGYRPDGYRADGYRTDGSGPDGPVGPRAWSAAEGRPTAGRPPATRAFLPEHDRRPAAPVPPVDRPSGVPRQRPAAPAALREPVRATPPAEADTARDRWRRKLWIGRLVAGVLSLLTLLGSGFVSFVSDSAGQQAEGIISDCAGGFACTGTTILLVGSDARVDAEGNPLSDEELRAVATEADGGGTSTDTMMLIHIPAGGGQATAVSIPRDSWIENPPPGPSNDGDELVPYAANKVNSFYGSAKFYTQERLVAAGGSDPATIERDSSNAGRKMLISVLEGVTGTHIDHYAEINLFGFYLLSNAIGGVPVCLVAPVDDPFSGAVFDAGPQEVQGTAALSFVRQRHGLPNGDLDRVTRQQAFLSGAISKVLSVGTLSNPATLASLVEAANRSIVLSDGFNLLELAEQMSSISSGNITFETIPTHGPEQSTSSDALHIDVAEIRQLFATIEDPDAAAGTAPASGTETSDAAVDRSAVTVDVQNATVTGGLAAGTSEGLTSMGWGAGEVSQFPGTTADEQQATTTISASSADAAAAALLRQDLGYGEVTVDDSLTAGRVLVVVGLDSPDAAGLRAGGVAFAGGTPVFVRAAAGEPINAATPGCVN
ncbi:LCP family protein [Nakamurella deserti]|uniref:LCP family protein n=1 Tax=Nakamurella deserti TaxID=2164074 RepID=UPI000DBE0584|nr:LCP family protein [Nakamurella deserti]